MISSYLKKRSEQKAARIKAATEAYNIEIEKAEKLVEDATKKMTSKPCPLADCQKCHTACVHFQPGRTVGICTDPFTGKISLDWRSPRCKLWS